MNREGRSRSPSDKETADDKTSEQENIAKSRAAIKRVDLKLQELRGELNERKVSNGETVEVIAEFEGIFNEGMKQIDSDLSMIDSELIITRYSDSVEDRWKTKYEKERERVNAMYEDFEKATEGTDFENLDDWRAEYDYLCEEKRVRDEKEQSVLSELGLKSIDELATRVRGTDRERDVINRKFREMIDVALDDMGAEDIVDVVVKMKELKGLNEKQSDVIVKLMNQVKVGNVDELMDVIQQKTLEHKALARKCRDLEKECARLKDLVRRDLTNGDIGRLNPSNARGRSSEYSDSDLEPEGNESDKNDDQLQKLRSRRRAVGSRRRSEVTTSNVDASIKQTPMTTRGRSVSSDDERTTVGHEVVTAAPSLSPADLPVLAPYDGTKESWKVFKAGFLLRYERMGDSGAKVILKEMLSGKAQIEYKGLPKEYESKSIRDCLKWLRDRCFGGTLYESRDIAKRLRQLTVRGRKVDVVCEEMEHMVDKLYESAAMREEQKKRELTFLYEHSREYRDLLKMLDEKKTYEEMKRHLQRSEYVERRDENHQSDRQCSVNGDRVDRRKCSSCGGMGHGRDRCPSTAVAEEGEEARYASVECYRCGETGHIAGRCKSKESVEGLGRHNSEGQMRSQSGVAANACKSGAAQFVSTQFTPMPPSEKTNGSGRWNGQVGSVVSCQREMGNVSEMNPAGVRRIVVTHPIGRDENKSVFNKLRPVNGKGGDEDQGGANSLRPVVDMSDGAVRECEGAVGAIEGEGPNRLLPAKIDEEVERQEMRKRSQPLRAKCVEEVGQVQDSLFFKRVTPVKGVIGGLLVEAYLDTGADVNLIDKSVVDRMSGVEVKLESQFPLSDFHGRPINMIGKIVVDVEMEIGRRCRVGFCVSEMDNQMVLLGNSALEAMGLELLMNEKEDAKEVSYERSMPFKKGLCGQMFGEESFQEMRSALPLKKLAPWRRHKPINGPFTPMRSTQYEKTRKKTVPVDEFECYRCRRLGHKRHDCPDRIKKMKIKMSSSEDTRLERRGM